MTVASHTCFEAGCYSFLASSKSSLPPCAPFNIVALCCAYFGGVEHAEPDTDGPDSDGHDNWDVVKSRLKCRRRAPEF